ncbi:YARHG domain-containing protein [Ferruginibacter paludis]|uniref:YARHG domain-containing protein n=1 Tax=Ferruginibacter paludis TaxID=1310417 RepID=UPI0025B295F7|nr:YARHG domain-containing protein [Ferruginibacter paludis]MDN3657923.1 YARHG domain-containing protein [Ferruginibacter paludis]
MIRLKRICSIFLFITAALLFACKSKNINAKSAAEPDGAEASMLAASTNVIGSYAGNFGDNMITLLITKVTGDSLEGRSVVGGNDRPFKGVMAAEDGVITVIAKEPGEEVHDGIFKFSFDNKAPGVLKGTWDPYQPTNESGSKEYTLQRRTFVYRTEVGSYPQGSQRLLKEEDVNNFNTEELEQMRNEIFARHGYCFKKKYLRQLFENKEWYIPITTEVKNMLTDVERKNITLIKRFEKYAAEYSDEFGR